ncbi:MAG: hypothetical protein WC107_04320 [Patescibacteria group bacterium]
MGYSKNKFFNFLIVVTKYVAPAIFVLEIIRMVNGFNQFAESFYKPLAIVTAIPALAAFGLSTIFLWKIKKPTNFKNFLLAVIFLLVYGYILFALLDLSNFIKYYLGIGN